MKKFLLPLIFLTSCVSNTNIEPQLPQETQTNTNSSISSTVINDETIIKLRKGVSPTEYAKENNLELVYKIGLDMYLFKGTITRNALRSDTIERFEKNNSLKMPPIQSKEVIVSDLKIYSDESPSNDPLVTAQYGIFKTNTDKAWKIQKGKPEVIVAVIDSGVDGSHPEFEGQLLPGYDFSSDKPTVGGNVDGYGHGTHVAGVIGAKTNNGIGIAGIAPNCKILPVRIFNNWGHTTSGASTAAIIWAVDNGAKVINASWGSPLPGQAFHDAIKYALEKDVVVVAAVGNSGNNDPETAGYPGKSPGVIGVAASTDIDGWATFSTFGDQVSVAAPGKGILSTYPMQISNGYRIMEGTSMAAPSVTAAVALIRSQFPNMNQKQVKELLEKTAKDIVMTGLDQYSGHGRIDIEKALLTGNGK